MRFKSYVASWQIDEHADSSCVRLGECPSAVMMVGALRHKCQYVRPVEKGTGSQYKLARP